MKKRPKNGIAKALRTPRYKMQVCQDRRKREEEKRLKNIERDLNTQAPEVLFHLQKALEITWMNALKIQSLEKTGSIWPKSPIKISKPYKK